MRDLQGLCVRRNSFSHARPRDDRSKHSKSAGCNEVYPFYMNHELFQHSRFIAGNGFSSCSIIFWLDIAGNVSANWLKNVSKINIFFFAILFVMRLTLPWEYSKRLESHQSFNSPKRSRSCNDRIEASFVYAINHIRKLASFCTDRSKVVRSNSLSDLGSNRRSRQPKYQKIHDLSLRERHDDSVKKEKIKDALDKKFILENRTDKPDLVTIRKTDHEEVNILPSSVLAQKAKKTNDSMMPRGIILRKRPFKIEDEGISIILNPKKLKERIKLLKCSTDYQSEVKSLEIDKSYSTLKPSFFDFQSSS